MFMSRHARCAVVASLLLLAAVGRPDRSIAFEVGLITHYARLKSFDRALPLASHVVLATVVQQIVAPLPTGRSPINRDVQLTMRADDYIRGDSIPGSMFAVVVSNMGYDGTLLPGVQAVMALQQQGGQFHYINMLGTTIRGDTAFVDNPPYKTDWLSLRDSLVNIPAAASIEANVRSADVALLGLVIEAHRDQKGSPWTWTGSFTMQVQHGYLGAHPPEPNTTVDIHIPRPTSYLENGIVPPVSIGDTLLVALVHREGGWEIAKGCQAVWRVRGDSISAELPSRFGWVPTSRRPLSEVLGGLR